MKNKISLINHYGNGNAVLKMNYKKGLASLLVMLTLSFSGTSLYAQSMGISNTLITPDPSSILELRTTSKGMLIPRMTTTDRDAISTPANGLMIYNTVSKQFNFYNGSFWVALLSGSASSLSVDSGSTLSTSSTTDVVLEGMSKTVQEAGTYLALFNGQVIIPAASNSVGFSTATAKSDLNFIYTDITNIPVTNTAHALTFGSGEILFPGVYTITGAMSIAGTLTLDGQGDANALFIIRGSAAFNTGADVTVKLINGASAENIYWVANDAIGLGANTIIQGTLFSNSAAIAVGAGCKVTGRLLTKGGALAFGPGELSLPLNDSSIDFRTVDTFIMFTGGGGVANTGASTYTSDIGTNLGAITGFESATVDGTIYQAGSTTTVTAVNHMATFSLYKNGVLILNSSRTRTHLKNPSDVSLQGFAAAAAGDTIDVRWKIDEQPSDLKDISVNNRILTLVKVGN
ncbi:Protein of unknown function [Flavobacterium gillisiae]|uniref:DUF3494 domain-containing protein n=1 Tax=Flavobacterium gillisiae TaxID=150146 RepID=A0A1H4G6G6_9FLAO|nr:ice-binding family protein [Flavobacterium gillisiae]SEB04272.1 Protein of unknown function [Flavobacterium gillisiae]